MLEEWVAEEEQQEHRQESSTRAQSVATEPCFTAQLAEPTFAKLTMLSFTV